MKQMFYTLGVFTPDLTLFTDASGAITLIAGAFVTALAVGLAFPVGRKVYRSVKSVISGA
jgi:hypothetical protein